MKRRITEWGWTGLGVHVMVYMTFLGLLTLQLDFLPERFVGFIAMAWLGVFIMHVVFLGSQAESSNKQKTEAAVEKPKREETHYALTDDGELEQIDGWEAEDNLIPNSEGKRALN